MNWNGFFRSKTVVFYLFLSLIGLLIIAIGLLKHENNIAIGGIIVIIVSILGIMLRIITKEPLQKKGWHKSKTMWFNAMLGLVGGVQAYSGNLQGFFHDAKYFGLFMVAVSAIGAVLRFLTTKPLEER